MHEISSANHDGTRKVALSLEEAGLYASDADGSTENCNHQLQGAIAKVAIYNYLLTQDQITNHYTVMTGQDPTGSCADRCTF